MCGEQIEDRLFRTLSRKNGSIGRIVNIRETGFLMQDDAGNVLYFFQTRPLHVPFGIAYVG